MALRSYDIQILRILAAAPPQGMTRQEIGRQLGITPQSPPKKEWGLWHALTDMRDSVHGAKYVDQRTRGKNWDGTPHPTEKPLTDQEEAVIFYRITLAGRHAIER